MDVIRLNVGFQNEIFSLFRNAHYFLMKSFMYLMMCSLEKKINIFLSIPETDMNGEHWFLIRSVNDNIFEEFRITFDVYFAYVYAFHETDVICSRKMAFFCITTARSNFRVTCLLNETMCQSVEFQNNFFLSKNERGCQRDTNLSEGIRSKEEKKILNEFIFNGYFYLISHFPFFFFVPYFNLCNFKFG